MTIERWPDIRWERMNSWTEPDEESGERLPITIYAATTINPKDDQEWGLMLSISGHDQPLTDEHRNEMIDAIREACE